MNVKKSKGLIGFNSFTIALVLIYFLCGVGVSYAYFAFNYENTSTITGTVVNVNATLTVNRVVGNDDGLVPMMDDALSNALNAVGTTNGACIDSLGNLSCQVYKITLTNNGSKLQHLVGTIELYPKSGTGNVYTNLKWRELTNQTTVNESALSNGMDRSILISNLDLEPKASKTWYIALWLSEIDADQREMDKGEFGGEVKFEVVKNLTASAMGTNMYDSFLTGVMEKNALSDASIDFSKTSEESNTNGIYVRNGTENDTNPIYYYRGNVNNNMIFGDYCWKIVRTTETGGLKLLYNGLLTYDGSLDSITLFGSDDYNTTTVTDFTFDASTSTWSSTNTARNTTGTIQFSVSTPGDYIMPYVASSYVSNYGYIYKNGILIDKYSGEKSGNLYFRELKVTDVIEVRYTKTIASVVGSDKFIFSIGKITNENVEVKPSCDNTKEKTLIGSSKFGSYVIGYMHGGDYTFGYESIRYLYDYETEEIVDNDTYIYGKEISYENGEYTLTGGTTSKSAKSLNSSSSTLNTYRYSCLEEDVSSCSTVYFIYYYKFSGYRDEYERLEDIELGVIKLTQGQLLDNEILNEIVDSNAKSSVIKNKLDSWYYDSIEQTGLGIYIEDTVWCNDRSFTGTNGLNGGSVNDYIYFSSYNRITPDLTCTRNIDKFTVSDELGNGDLEYPVGLLTSDEAIFAGGNKDKSNNVYYLNNNIGYWLFSPSFIYKGWENFSIYSTGNLKSTLIDTTNIGVRPSISLKDASSLRSYGDGSVERPYILLLD